jgi:hypothetical protein
VSSYLGPIPIGAIIVVVLFASAMLAMQIARFMPASHLSAETKSVVSVSAAVVGTMSALVVGLLISTANGAFTAKTQEITQISADIVSMDRLLRRYGPQADDIRALLHRYAEAQHQDLFPDQADRPADLQNAGTVGILETLQDKLLALAPATPEQHWLEAQALDLAAALMAAHWDLLAQDANRSPVQLLLLVMIWFIIIFASFGLFSPRNMTATVMIFLCAVAIGGAIRMAADLQTPFQGLIRLSDAPLAHAVETISR